MAGDSAGVVLWWQILRVVSVVNLVAWTLVAWHALRSPGPADPRRRAVLRWQVVLSLLFASGCAFRSFLPGAEGQRICIVDSWLSSALMTRSVATIAELSLAAQWVLMLSLWAREHGHARGAAVARLLLPLIAVAEVCSWYTTLSSNFLGSVIEESIWALSALLVLLVVAGLWSRSRGRHRSVAGVVGTLIALYVAFMCTVDVPMYITRWRSADPHGASGAAVVATIFAPTRSVVTLRWSDWRDEIPWMTLYFSVGVWVSIALVRAPLLLRAATPRALPADAGASRPAT